VPPVPDVVPPEPEVVEPEPDVVPDPFFVVVPLVVVVFVVVAAGAALATAFGATVATFAVTGLGTDVADLLFGLTIGVVTELTRLAAST